MADFDLNAILNSLTPDDIEALNGVSRFEICKDQIVYE